MRINKTLEKIVSPELRLILKSCSGREELTDLPDLAVHELDWSRVLLLSLWHKTAFVTMRGLQRTNSIENALKTGNLPLLLLNHWKQLHAVNTHRSKILIERAQHIRTTAHQANLPLVVAKGGVLLIGRCYTVDERKMYDIDFLAAREDINQLVTFFEEAGFFLGEFNHENNEIRKLPHEALRAWLLLGRGMPNFLRSENDPFHPYSIAQVQFELGSTELKKTIPAQKIFEYCEKRITPKGEALLLSDGALFMQLCLHIFRESRETTFKNWNMDFNLIKYLDLARFIDAIGSSDALQDCLETAHQVGFGQECLDVLQELQLVFEIPLLNGVVPTPSGEDANEKQRQLAFTMEHLGVSKKNSDDSQWEQIVGKKTS